MKVRTVGMLAALGAMVTSTTVWSLTPPGGLNGEVASQASPMGLEAPTMRFDDWTFSDGTTLHVEGRLGHPVVAAGRSNETFLLVRTEAPATTTGTAKTPPLNLAIVVDRSGSMAGKRMDNAIQAAQGMVDKMKDGDRVSVITYDTRTQLLVPPTILRADNRGDVRRTIGTIAPAGDTCISCGLEAGLRELATTQVGQGAMVSRMLLLSDGEATAGVRDLDGFRQLAERARRGGVSVSAIGVDVDYNEEIMSVVGRHSNGRHAFVEDVGSLSQMFRDELSSLHKTVAGDTDVRIRLAPGVELLEVFDRSSRTENGEVVVPVGSVAEGDERTVLMRLRLPAGGVGSQPVADVKVDFRDFIKGGRGHCEGKLTATRDDDAGRWSALDPVVGARVTRTLTARSLRRANSLAKKGEVDQARKQLQQAKDRLKKKRQKVGWRHAPTRRGVVDKDFDAQMAALKSADREFAQPAPNAPPAPVTGAGQARPSPPRATIRRNMEKADAFSF
ncbi:MAG: VWA domain-containing protein [Myxococcota bacterium]